MIQQVKFTKATKSINFNVTEKLIKLSKKVQEFCLHLAAAFTVLRENIKNERTN